MSIEVFSKYTNAEESALTGVDVSTLIFNTDMGKFRNSVDGGSTWITLADIDDITLQNAFNNGNEILQGASTFTIKSDNSTAATTRYFSDTTGVAALETLEIKSDSLNSLDALKTASAIKYTTTNAIDATFSQDIHTQAWSAGILKDVLHFEGLQRRLSVAPQIQAVGDAQVDPWLILKQPNELTGTGGLCAIWSYCKDQDSIEKNHEMITKQVTDVTTANFSTQTAFYDYWQGGLTAFLVSDPANKRVSIVGGLVNVNQNDATFGPSVQVGDYIFSAGQMLCFQTPTGGTCLQSRVAIDEAVTVGSILAVSPTTNFRAVNHSTSGDDMCIGVATTAGASAGNIIQFCYAGDVDVQMEDGQGAIRGDLIVPSNTTAGRSIVDNSPGVRQSFGVAWETVAAATPGPMVRIRLGLSSSS
jgi:hypothetical protein